MTEDNGVYRPFEAIQIRSTDNTATLLTDGKAGDTLVVACGARREEVQLRADIPFGHKMALVRIEPDESVVKYGEIMGCATERILPGDWVHVHNTASLRGRGDDTDDDAAAKSAMNAFHADALPPAGTLSIEKPLFNLRGRTFKGWLRPDGSAGTRNLVGILSTVVCANDVCAAIGEKFPETAVFTHQQGCSQTGPDVHAVEDVLVNLARNPNLGAVLFVSLGCESVNARKVAQAAAAAGKPVDIVVIQEAGGKSAAVAAGEAIVRDFAQRIKAPAVDIPIEKLRLGLKCGSSDTTQGLSSNIIIGRITDAFVNAGAQVVIGETTEFMGAEHIAARHASDPETAQAIVDAVTRMENRAKAMGVDMRGGQPTRGNIEGGLTTIEEKSLGALAKAGSAVFQAVMPYGTPCSKAGLVMMDSPGREPELLTGLAAMGCNLVAFATGRGAPQGFPFMPVVKITGNARTWEKMNEHMDVYVGNVILGRETIEEASSAVLESLLSAADGKPVKAELTGYVKSMNIYTTGPTI